MGMGDDDMAVNSRDNQQRSFRGDMKRDLASMIRELQNTAEDARSQIDQAVARSTEQLEAAAAFWKTADFGPDFLRSADHVVTLTMHLPRAERVQLGVNAWGTGPTADLFATNEGDYDVLVVLKRKEHNARR